MKKIYTLVLIALTCLELSAQITLTQLANEPLISDTWNIRRYDSTGVVPKNTGTGQIWNFNTVTTPNTFTETTTYINPASTPSASSYPASNVASTRGGTSVDYYKTSLNNFQMLGFIDGGNGNKIVFGAAAPWYVWPISYGSTTTGTFSATETGTSTSATWLGNMTYSACGAGTVILPGGNVHTNCLLYRRIININMSGSYTATMNLVQYEFFSSTRKMPILKMEYQTFNSGSSTSKNMDMSVDINAMSVGIPEFSKTNNEFVVFPNPSNQVINVSLPSGSVPSSIEVVDVNGKVVAEAYNSKHINIAHLQRSIYYLRVKNNDQVLQKVIIVSE